jgi:L-rhamnose mutarotase
VYDLFDRKGIINDVNVPLPNEICSILKIGNFSFKVGMWLKEIMNSIDLKGNSHKNLFKMLPNFSFNKFLMQIQIENEDTFIPLHMVLLYKIVVYIKDKGINNFSIFDSTEFHNSVYHSLVLRLKQSNIYGLIKYIQSPLQSNVVRAMYKEIIDCFEELRSSGKLLYAITLEDIQYLDIYKDSSRLSNGSKVISSSSLPILANSSKPMFQTLVYVYFHYYNMFDKENIKQSNDDNYWYYAG